MMADAFYFVIISTAFYFVIMGIARFWAPGCPWLGAALVWLAAVLLFFKA